jgi:SAM-dependent methyltransferase
MAGEAIFDSWPERYDQWFATPVGRLIKRYENRLVQEYLKPQAGELILDAGCGTGVFTQEILASGARVIGLDIAFNMVKHGRDKLVGKQFSCLQGDILSLPFRNDTFDKTVSITALDFLAEGEKALGELFRVTRPGGIIVVATLNSLSPWAWRRLRKAAREGHSLFNRIYFRSPQELLALAPGQGRAATAIHFDKEEDPLRIPAIEEAGEKSHSDRGAFLLASWVKPARLACGEN